MKAICVRAFGGPDVLKLEEIETPEPAAGQVLVRVKAAGVNPVDTYIRTGTYPIKPGLPYTPGMDAAGVIEKAGADTPFKKGDRVYTLKTLSGAYAEFALCSVSQVHRLPAGISFEQGACIPIPYATAWHALFHKACARPGDTVLIHGASGGVGIAAVQIARAAGLRVAGTAGTDTGRELVLREGAELALDHKDSGHGKKFMEWTGGRGADIIVEMLADVNLGGDLALLARGGRVVVVGCRGQAEINPRELMAQERSIIGMVIFNASENESKAIHSALYAGLENGTLRPIPGRQLPLAEAARAHREVIEGPAFGKIILVPEEK